MKKTPSIIKIDKEIYEVGKRHNLNTKDMGFVQDIIKGKTQTEAYKNNIAKPTTTDRNTIDTSASEKVRNPEVQDTLKEVLINQNITKKSVIQTHKEILNKAIDINQLSVAEKANSTFMKLLGIDSFQPSNQTNIQINIDKLTKEDINNKLRDIITID